MVLCATYSLVKLPSPKPSALVPPSSMWVSIEPIEPYTNVNPPLHVHTLTVHVSYSGATNYNPLSFQRQCHKQPNMTLRFAYSILLYILVQIF